MSLAVEGATNVGFDSASSSSLNITTAGIDRIVVLCLHAEGPVTQVWNTPTASGLTFARRAHVIWPARGTSWSSTYDVWWAYAAAQLTATTISISLSSGNTDGATAEVFAVSGVHSSRFATGGWDDNVGLPISATVPTPGSSSVPAITGINTTNLNDLVFVDWVTSLANIAGSGAPSGFTRVDTIFHNDFDNASSQAIDEQAFSSAQSSLSVTSTVAGNSWWGVIADAMTSDASLRSPRHRGIFVG